MQYSDRELEQMAKELREAYGLPPDAQLWMRPNDLIEWKQERLQQAIDTA